MRSNHSITLEAPAAAEANGVGHAWGTPSLNGHGNGELLRRKLTVRRRPWRLGATLFAIWTLLALIETGRYYFFPDEEGKQIPAMRSLGLGFSLWYPWGVAWLLIYPLSRRFNLGSPHWPRRLILLMAVCIILATAKLFLDYPIILSLYCPRPWEWTLPKWMLMGLQGPFFRYILYLWAMIGICHALEFYRQFRERELRAAQLESSLTRAQLQLLKTQLQPHFLFNTLNAISALIHTDVEAADHMLARLGDLLRLSLEDFGLHEASLTRELEIVRAYLEIEQARLGSRLQVDWDIDPGATEALVPTFALQPIIENAIHHGIAPRPEPGRLEIRARRDGDWLRLEVRDDGPGFSDKPSNGTGVGLSNTRARLQHLYGATSQRMELGNDPRGGGVVKIVLPFREPITASSKGDVVRIVLPFRESISPSVCNGTNGEDPNADRG